MPTLESTEHVHLNKTTIFCFDELLQNLFGGARRPFPLLDTTIPGSGQQDTWGITTSTRLRRRILGPGSFCNWLIFRLLLLQLSPRRSGVNLPKSSRCSQSDDSDDDDEEHPGTRDATDDIDALESSPPADPPTATASVLIVASSSRGRFEDICARAVVSYDTVRSGQCLRIFFYYFSFIFL
eukprot:SAG11_NODE_2547_length_3231_cov_113.952107_1_plen_182_part_00